MIRTHQKTVLAFALLCAVLAYFPNSLAAPQAPVKAMKDVTVTRESMALSYPEGVTIGIKFQGTHRLTGASGEAKIERKKGMTEIEIELDEMKPATFFGGDYNTYVLWTVSPEGVVDNVGEFILEGNRSKLNVSTRLETFGMFITAEPHFLVSAPSRFVVMENTRPASRIGNPIQISQIKYRGYDGVYNFENESLANMKETKGERRSDLAAARTSVSLAERNGAEQYAAAELGKAREALKKVESAVASGSDKRNVMLMGHEVVRLAVDAQKLAEERSFQAALDSERKKHTDETARLEQLNKDAQTEAERSKLAAQQKELQLRMEEQARRDAMKQAEESARRAADEERLRREADERARLAQAQTQQLAAAKSESDLAAERANLAANSAKQDADRARQEREEARGKMQQALSSVVETRETARGLVLNLPDILFEFNKATLLPQAREILSKVAGILLVAKGYRLSVEGHTDSIGSEDYNQKLSEKRAQSVHDYLINGGLSSSIISTRGFGKTQPIADNSTAAGRQKNRRVEIVIEDTEKLPTGQ